MEDVIINANENLPFNCVAIKPPDGMFRPRYVSGQWVEYMNQSSIDIIVGDDLESLKQKKYDELDKSCESAILGYFKSKINGVEFSFSYDMKAQSRFNGVATSFSRGYITEIEWTAYIDGIRTSIMLTDKDFDTVAMSALIHTTININKFRGKIIQLESAQTPEEISAIVW